MACKSCKDNLPGLMRQAVNVTVATGQIVAGAVRGHGVYVPEHIRLQRLSHCRECPFRVRDAAPKYTKFIRCGECGCWMDGRADATAKASFVEMECPLPPPDQKWGKYRPEGGA
jgi:hypothetical protein